MNTPKYIITASLLVISSLFTGCLLSEKAKEEVVEAKENVLIETKDYKEDMKKFKQINSNQIAANEKSIAEFNTRIENEKSDVKEAYKRKIAELNAKNSDMKKKISDFKTDSESNWNTFKTEFSHDMEELGQAFKNFTVKSEK